MKHWQYLKAVTGFILLFLCYHAAEYAILFMNHPGLFIAGMAVFFFAVWLVAKWNGLFLSEFGLRITGKTFIFFLAGLGIGLLYAGMAFFISTSLDIERVSYIPAPNVIITQVLYFGFGTMLTSLAEDIFTRGYLYKFLHRKMSPVLFAILSAVVFVLNHIYRYNDGALLMAHLFIAGVLLVIPLIITGQLWITVGIHFGMNMIYQVTNNIMHTDAGSNTFPAFAVLVICEAAVIPLALLLAARLKNYQTASTKAVAHSVI